ncbi:DUF4143 domain-containing protein [Actinoplanes sp. TBRC 11911]|uniref:DUF4143 domain-containing protein n=1 Tax=Actinoplanes sp. TBRC 11911 TaxID=2729386 RepID=UPI0037BE5278
MSPRTSCPRCGLFVIERLPAWGKTLRARATAAPKVHVIDSGVAARLMRVSAAQLATQRVSTGAPTTARRSASSSSLTTAEFWHSRSRRTNVSPAPTSRACGRCATPSATGSSPGRHSAPAYAPTPTRTGSTSCPLTASGHTSAAVEVTPGRGRTGRDLRVT